MANIEINKKLSNGSYEKQYPITKSENVQFSDANFESKNIGGAVKECFQYADDGKQKIATAVTGKGVPTSKSDTFQKMANNITAIETDPSIGTTNAVASDILSGKKAVSKGNLLTGTMSNRGAVSGSLAVNGTYVVPEGYHNGSGRVRQNIATKGAQTYTPGTSNQSISSGVYLTGSQTIKGDSSLTPANIKKGTTIFGKTGEYEGFNISAGSIGTPQDVDPDYFELNSISDGRLTEGVIITDILFVLSCRWDTGFIPRMQGSGSGMAYYYLYDERRWVPVSEGGRVVEEGHINYPFVNLSGRPIKFFVEPNDEPQIITFIKH